MGSRSVSPSIISRANSLDVVPTIVKNEVVGIGTAMREDDSKLEKDDTPVNDTSDDFPDGGTRAWLVTLGVRLHFDVYLLQNSFSNVTSL